MLRIMAPVPHIEQENARFCGPAVAQMVLAANGFGVSSQAELFDHWCNNGGDVPWTSSPRGIALTLGARMPERAARHQVVTSTSVEAITRVLCRAVSVGETPVMLVFKLDHWIVVNGCMVSDWPASAHDGAYAIHGLMIHDPAIRRDLRTPEAPLHHLVAYREWRRSYARFPVSAALVNYPPYQEKYIAICAGEPDGAFTQHDVANVYGPARSPEQAMGDARRALIEARLLAVDLWQAIAWESVPGRPVLTHSLTRDDDATYHVPFLRRTSREHARSVLRPFGTTSGGPRGTLSPGAIAQLPVVPLVIRVGAVTGEFREAIAVPDGGLDLASIAPREKWVAAGLLLPES